METIRALQIEVSMLSKVVLQNRMALDLLTAKERGICAIINQSCCAYIDETHRIETDLQTIWEHTEVLHQVLLDDTSFGFTELWKNLSSWLDFVRLKQLCYTLPYLFSCV